MSTWIIYSVLCAKTGKEYVGLTRQKISTRWKGHLSSARSGKGSFLHRVIRRHGAESFIVSEITRITSYDEAVEAERNAIATRGTLAPGGYNLTIGGDGAIGGLRSSATKKKIADTLRRLGVKPSDRAHARSREAWKARGGWSQEERERMSERMMGQPDRRTPAGVSRTVAGAKAAMTGQKKSPEHRAAISAARKGMKFSETHRANIAAVVRRRPPPSGETRRKLREAHTGQRRSPESITRMRNAARARMAKRRALGLVNRKTEEGRANRIAAAAKARAALAAKRSRLPSPVATPPQS